MLNVENMQRVAKALSISVVQIFEGITVRQVTMSETTPITSPDEITLLKHFKLIEHKPDRQTVVQVARRLAAKR